MTAKNDASGESENDNESEADALARDPVWRAALRAAVTPEAIEYAREYARFHLRHGADAYCDETPEELADTALSETALGRGRWHPARGALGPFLAARVRYQLGVRAREAARTVRLDVVDDDHPQTADLDRALSHDPATEDVLATHEGAAAMVELVREQCANDGEVLAYLGARLAGHEGYAAIAAAMGTSINAARAAHRRLVRCVRTLPVHTYDRVVA